MTRLTIILLFAGFFVFLLISPTDAYSQCACWTDGLEAEFRPNSRGTVCDVDENQNQIVISLSAPGDFCDEQVILGTNSDGCTIGKSPGNPQPPPGINCSPGLSLVGDDSEGICEQDIEDFCNELNARNVPTLSEWGLIAMAGVLGIVSFMVMRRKRVKA